MTEEVVLTVRLTFPPGTGLAAAVGEVTALPEYSVARQECEAVIWMSLARHCWAEADRIRSLDRRRHRSR